MSSNWERRQRLGNHSTVLNDIEWSLPAIKTLTSKYVELFTKNLYNPSLLLFTLCRTNVAGFIMLKLGMTPALVKSLVSKVITANASGFEVSLGLKYQRKAHADGSSSNVHEMLFVVPGKKIYCVPSEGEVIFPKQNMQSPVSSDKVHSSCYNEDRRNLQNVRLEKCKVRPPHCCCTKVCPDVWSVPLINRADNSEKSRLNYCTILL